MSTLTFVCPLCQHNLELNPMYSEHHMMGIRYGDVTCRLLFYMRNTVFEQILIYGCFFLQICTYNIFVYPLCQHNLELNPMYSKHHMLGIRYGDVPCRHLFYMRNTVFEQILIYGCFFLQICTYNTFVWPLCQHNLEIDPMYLEPRL